MQYDRQLQSLNSDLSATYEYLVDKYGEKFGAIAAYQHVIRKQQDSSLSSLQCFILVQYG